MHSRLVLILILYAICLPGCRQDDQLPLVSQKAIAYSDLKYGNSNSQTMDLYLPAGRSHSATPVLVLIHGGGWVSGDKTAFSAALIDIFSADGYAVANINYDVSTDVAYKYPTQLYDIDAALTFLASNSEHLNINTGHIVLMGRSAGAHLALLYAYTHNVAQNIKAVLDFFGPADLTDPTIRDSALKDHSQIFMGKPYEGNEALWASASPIYQLSGAVPTYIFQGYYDSTVYPIQSQRLSDSLKQRGIPCTFEEDWYGHGLDSAGWLKYTRNAKLFADKYIRS